MKTVDIVTSEMHLLHGANRVTEKLIKGRDIFAKEGYNLRYVVSQDGLLDCQKYDSSVLGRSPEGNSCRKKRDLIERLKPLRIYNSYFIQKSIVNHRLKKYKIVLNFFNCLPSRPDIIIYQDMFTASFMLKELSDIPSLLITHAAEDPLEQLFLSRPALKSSKEEKFLRKQLEYLFHNVSRVVTICHSEKKYMMDVYGLDCPCIINGIEDIEPEKSIQKKNADGKIHIVILASVQYRKGQDIAIKALSELTEEQKDKLVLHLVGGGSGLNDIKALTKDLNLEKNVDICGQLQNIDMILQTMDVFMLPSRADTVPIAIIEAMRAALPVFATDVGEIANMLEGCGVLIEANKDSVLSLYHDLINNRYDLKALGMKSRERYLEEFTLPSMISKYCQELDVL